MSDTGSIDRSLDLQRCDDGHVQHPPRTVCTTCMSDRLELVPASGGGAVDAYTVVHRAPEPGIQTPYAIARVLLDEGPIVLTRLVGQDVDAWSCDDRVRLAFVETDGRQLAVFEKEGT